MLGQDTVETFKNLPNMTAEQSAALPVINAYILWKELKLATDFAASEEINITILNENYRPNVHFTTTPNEEDLTHNTAIILGENNIDENIAAGTIGELSKESNAAGTIGELNQESNADGSIGELNQESNADVLALRLLPYFRPVRRRQRTSFFLLLLM